MTKAKVLIVLLSVLFCVVVSATVFTLTVTASEGGFPAPSKDGVWLEVCCGPGCAGGQDYCAGDGRYTCCR